MELWQVVVIVPCGMVLVAFFGLVWSCLIDRAQWIFSGFRFSRPPESFAETIKIVDPGIW